MKKKIDIKKAIGLAITKEELIYKTEKLVLKDRIEYAQAICQICLELELDPEDVAKLISGPLKTKLQVEAQNNNVLPKPNTATLE
jgi:hypothetical protein